MTKCLSKKILHVSVAGRHVISLNLNKCFKQSKKQHRGNSKAYTITLVELWCTSFVFVTIYDPELL